jgi:uncharacterized protein YecE (DUF72 family)
MPGTIHIGTSGWNYRHWKPTFYPEKMPQREWLKHYAEHLNTTEINNSFYRLPSEETVRAWRDTVPDDFIFSYKASRYLTHMKKLGDPEDPLAKVYDRARVLGKRRGPILFQLPPRWRFNEERLEHFLKSLRDAYLHTMEFRDATWVNDRTLELLARHNVAFCIYELAGQISPKEVTADFVYVRLHGPGAEKYEGSYDGRTLAGWRRHFETWADLGKDVYCYFDNDQKGYAVHNAIKMRQMMG